MALHSELPIYKVAYDLLSLILQVARNKIGRASCRERVYVLV